MLDPFRSGKSHVGPKGASVLEGIVAIRLSLKKQVACYYKQLSGNCIRNPSVSLPKSVRTKPK
jgi:hypothetical protein